MGTIGRRNDCTATLAGCRRVRRREIMMADVNELRQRLDDIDARLIALVGERQATIGEIAVAKRSTGSSLRDYKLEKEVFDKARANALKAGIAPRVAEDVLRPLIRYSLSTQEQAAIGAHRVGNGQRALVIGGAGKMGAWFSQFLISRGFDVEIADPAAASIAGAHTDWRLIRLDHDLIVVATPLGSTNAVLGELADKRPKGVVFDLASLKSPLKSGLAQLRERGVRVTSVHPMFGPDVVLLSGRHIVFVDVGCAQATEYARELFHPTMAAQVVMTLDEHDMSMAKVLGLSHAINIAFLSTLDKLGSDATRLAQLSSTTFDSQFDTARRVAAENPQLYYEIQHLNPHSLAVLECLRNALEDFVAAAQAKDGALFRSTMDRCRRFARDRRRNGDREA